jgi:hypothetical protein
MSKTKKAQNAKRKSQNLGTVKAQNSKRKTQNFGIADAILKI